MTKDHTDKNIVSNEKINPVKLERAKKIILELQNELKSLIAGPFRFWPPFMTQKGS